MKKLVTILSLVSISYTVFAVGGLPAKQSAADFMKNQLIVASSDINKIGYLISGSGPDTLATELLSYLKAGVASGLTVQTADPTHQEQNYKAGNIVAKDSSSANVFPPMSISINRSTAIWPHWSVVYSEGVVTIQPSSDDGATIAKLMDAFGAKPIVINDPALPYTSLRYVGKNVNCIAEATDATKKDFTSATCWLKLKN